MGHHRGEFTSIYRSALFAARRYSVERRGIGVGSLESRLVKGVYSSHSMDAWSITLYVLSATADVILGAFWYHPRIFGATWVRAMNLSPEMAEHGRRHKHLFTVIAFFASMVTAATL